ncbi:hypothetical protein BDY21DRAFT_1449 [Lineolata rhizophorae]|uniref:Uncharacterized protein n=1 Tax=Lineolata rhizophorae TaxID=578093 RepID=A0A6A6PCY7_9PEZI|nr:hypothetical protein BDY21DRAFT_1449 [Lineolata rhizophorae]
MASRRLGFSVLHVAAANRPSSPEQRTVLDMLLAHFKDPNQLNATAETSASSTALQIGVAMHNDIFVTSLINAGVSAADVDYSGETPIQLAWRTFENLTHAEGSSHNPLFSDKLRRSISILFYLGKRTVWPNNLELMPNLLEALDEAKPLIQEMMKLPHSVFQMERLEVQVQTSILSSMDGMLSSLNMADLYFVCSIIRESLNPIFQTQIEYWIRPNQIRTKNTDTSTDMDQIKGLLPLCRSMDATTPMRFQLAAAFEWLLDETRKGVRDGRTDLGEVRSELASYAQDPNPKYLPLNHRLVEFPSTLLQWYEDAVQADDFKFILNLDRSEREMADVRKYLETLRLRESIRQSQQRFDVVEFDESF